MRKLAFRGICIIACYALFVAGVHAADEQQALNDWNALEESAKNLEKLMDDVVPSYVANIVSQDDDAVLAALAEYERNLKDQIADQLQSFTEKYGDVDSMDSKLSELIDIDWRSGKHPTTQASRIYTNLKAHVENIAQARLNKSEELFRRAEDAKSHMDAHWRLVTEENYANIKNLLETALKYDPENENAKTWLKDLDNQKKEAFAAIEKMIDDAKWPGHYANFAGPGDPNELAKTAMTWIQNDEQGRKDHTFAVAVRGDWVSAKKNLLGQTIQWGLPIWSACYDEEEKSQGVARVFALTILTQEGGPNVKQEPPWTYTWVGDNYPMRVKNIPAGRAAAAAPGEPRTGRGFFGVIFWLALVGANLIAGLLAASSVLQVKVPQLESVYRSITPIRPLLGVIVLAVGLVVFLFDLIRLAPLANILPIASAVIAGLLLGKEMIIEKASGTKAEETVSGVMEKQKEKVEKLEKQQVPIGFACLVLAFLHLLIGRIILF